MTSKSKCLSDILAQVSLGELIDKITILEIKKVHITSTPVSYTHLTLPTKA